MKVGLAFFAIFHREPPRLTVNLNVTRRAFNDEDQEEEESESAEVPGTPHIRDMVTALLQEVESSASKAQATPPRSVYDHIREDSD